MKIVITGGHHSSALPVIKKLREQKDIEIYWFGHRYSQKGNKADTLEYKEITSLEIPFFDLKAGKFYKTYDVIRLLRIPFGLIQSFILLLKVKPDIILSFGGYLAVPVVIAGWVLRIPSVTHEQTVVVGYANKLIAYFVKKIFISWKDSEKYFPKDKVIYTGIPIREAIFKSSSNFFDVNKKLPTLYVMGGKTGSHKLNEIIKESLSELLEFCNIIHQCGDSTLYKDYEGLEAFSHNLKNMGGKYYLRKFILENEIGEVFTKADVVVARSGAHTISELLALKKPAILIPISWVSHNEQYKNAQILEEAGLAEIIEEDSLNSEMFIRVVKEFLNNIGRYKIVDSKYEKLIKKDSAEIIANELLKQVTKKEKNTKDSY